MNQPKRKANRLSNYDYSSEGIYFVTVCSKNRSNIFSEIKTHNVGTALAAVRLQLTELGNIIDKQWNNVPAENDHIELDEYIIMPNHIHGIINICRRTGASPVPTLSKIIGSFKSKSSVEYLKYIKQNGLNVPGQIGQRSFHDHVIRNEESLQEIRDYIINNPSNWETDNNNMNKNT